jgi:LPS export ABC transporter protein LptC
MTRPTQKVIIVLIAVICITLAGVSWLFYQERKSGPVTADLPDNAVRSIMKLDGVHQTATKNGAVQWVLDAASAELEAKSGHMLLHAPKVRFFLENGSQVDLTADEGILNTRSNDMKVIGNVKAHNDRYTLLTEELSYQHEKRVLESTVPVQIIGDEISLRAATMTYNLQENKALFSGHVVGHVNEDLSL